ncbi:MAG: RNA-directed DNA polymerase [Deltaproteobacteria bacterium]|nr:RNA-directed DNA polymerase [Deltaproteobacteria bacterium]
MGSALYQTLCSWENLLLAFQKASRGKRGRPAAAAFEYRLEDNLIDIQRDLRDKTYLPGPYNSFLIHDPKRRLISAAPFRDRVVHHALCNVIEPLFERSFIFDTYANRVGKGNHRALDRAQAFCRRHRFVLPCDVRHFFPSIDHAILKEILARKLRDEDTIWLVERIIDSGRGVLDGEYEVIWFPGDDLFSPCRPRGLPIGNLTSQFWANCYLNGLDHFIKRELRCPGYVRYVDDMLLFGDDRVRIWEWKSAIIERLQDLRLKIHERRAQVRPVEEGIPFLGFVVYPHRRRLKRRKGIEYGRKLRCLAEGYRAGKVSLEQVSASVRGWVNHVQYGDTFGLRAAVLASVKFTRGGA